MNGTTIDGDTPSAGPEGSVKTNKWGQKIPSITNIRSREGSVSNSPGKKTVKNMRSNSKTKTNGLISFKSTESNQQFFDKDIKILREASPLKNYDKDSISLQTPYIDDDFHIHFNKQSLIEYIESY